MTTHDDIRFGVLLSTDRYADESDGDVLARTVEVARFAEELGLDDLWLTEHHFLGASVNPSALGLAAYLLGKTHTVHVGTAVTVLPLHSPVHVAEQTALLDQLSGGRFVLGVGRGFPGVEYDVIGPGLASWRAGLAEPLDLTLATLNGEVTTGIAHGLPAPLRPSPAVRSLPRPPVYVAAGSPATTELAADRGLPLLLFYDKGPEAKAQMVAHYDARARAGGRPAPPWGHAFAVFTQVTESAERARRLMGNRARFILSLNNDPSRLAARPESVPPPVSPESVGTLTDRLLGTQPVGSVETCVERLVRHVSVSGCRRVMCQVEAAEKTGDVLRNLERLATEVFPAVRRAVGAVPGRGAV
ncbi:LLM class flavin-dependent oxidoreductase [Streptomyces capillispiralis]|uniref:Alkanesulfonate monooxygenase SsuD/methylene tetrahydromethanopterin reductase-like flavin-dependent oxidoreductase (Luciferase family) n=1 Tax=Streptomyces capillispiralis TaxID=68182 RepID=A0A561TGR2_9ACTN|nr:LLM class flavin-dependent oxidoreductase [Streptomyces capillispiralis]TWF86296.1 alkanesulfonate monooxygenase SsuD/methylene tetrahydromethanopterin reductase-like flavin-dependent oxidoreductase (luciferase family) [Streptomyces capillispiralis]GHH91221.1 alkanal monooxygenase [Streptomyces capillispiralis]